MTNNIKLMSSTIAGRVPTTSNIGVGNLAINHNDNALYAVTTVANTVTAVTQINGPQTVTLTGDVTASATTAGSITTTLATSGVTAGTYGDVSHIPQITVDSKGRTTLASNIAITIPAAFTGNLAGNNLIDTTSNKVNIAAAPYRAVTATQALAGLITNTPSYTSGVLQPPGSTYNMQTVAAAIQANITLATSGGNNRQTSISSSYGQFYLTGNMNSNDRIRGSDSFVEIDLNGYNWGADGSTSRERGTIVGARGGVIPFGSGTIGHSIGMNAVVQPTGSGGGDLLLNYVTGQFVNITQATSGSSNSNAIGTARMLSGQITASTGNFANVIGMHLSTAWATTSGSGTITNKYAILIEDTASPIQTASPINTTSTLTVGNYASSSMPTGAVGMIVAVNNAGGKLAYWDTTNSRWSYVFDNSAV